MRWFRPLLAGATGRDRLIACLGAALGVMVAGLVAALATRAPGWPLIVAPIGASAVLVFAVPASPLAQPWPVIGGNVLSAALGVMVAGLVAALATRAPGWPLIVAPIGASAVLVFAVPASPLAQPWPVIGGNVLSAALGVLVAGFDLPVAVATGVAVGGAILLMSLARCLHPPGGAAALSAVLLAQSAGHVGWTYPLVPVGLDSLLLVVAGIAFHRAAGHSYPHRPAPAAPGFAAQDIDAALADMHEAFDIDRADLDALLSRAAAHAALRQRPSGRSAPRR